MRRLFYALAAFMLVTSALAISACGDDDDDDGGSASSGEGGGELVDREHRTRQRRSRSLYQTVQANQVFQLVYTPLVTYNHEEGEARHRDHPRPGRGGPRADQRRQDLRVHSSARASKYSDGTPVKASDFENTIKRLLKLGSVWSSFYIRDRRGVASSRRRATSAPTSQGIVTDDKTGKITINLAEPDTKVLFALAEPYTSPTPAAKSPGKSLKQPPPGVGPYVLDIVDFTRQYTLTKNPKFDIPGHPQGELRQDHRSSERQRHEDDAGRDQRRGRLHDRGPDGRPASGGPAEVRRPLSARLPTRRTLLLLPERHDPAVRQAGGAPGGQLRASTATRWCGSSVAGSRRAARSCRPT